MVYKSLLKHQNVPAEIKSNIITAYKNYQGIVDLSRYNVYEKTDKDGLKQVMTEVINVSERCSSSCDMSERSLHVSRIRCLLFEVAYISTFSVPQTKTRFIIL